MKAIILGAGGFGHEVAALAQAGGIRVVGFLDSVVRGEPVPGIPVLGGDELLATLRSHGVADAVFLAVGQTVVRERLLKACRANGLALPSLVHPSASLLTRQALGEGAIVYPGVVVLSDCVIGEGVLLNSGATLGHDVIVGACCNVSPGAHVAGRVTIGARTTIGIGASVKENVRIGADAVIGAGSVVLKDVPDGVIAYGVPATIRRQVLERS